MIALICAVMLVSCSDFSELPTEPGQTPRPSPAQSYAPTPSAGGETAVWELGPDQAISASSTNFTARVSRLECNSGVTGAVLAPDVQIAGSEVVVTFQVEPQNPNGANCQGNNWVPYQVELGEPIGNRPLIDGQCLPGREAERTSFCRPDGRRWTP